MFRISILIAPIILLVKNSNIYLDILTVFAPKNKPAKLNFKSNWINFEYKYQSRSKIDSI